MYIVFTCFYIVPSGKLTQLWKITIFNGKFHYKSPFSIAMLNYQRVFMKLRGHIFPGFQNHMSFTASQPHFPWGPCQANPVRRQPPKWLSAQLPASSACSGHLYTGTLGTLGASLAMDGDMIIDVLFPIGWLINRGV